MLATLFILEIILGKRLYSGLVLDVQCNPPPNPNLGFPPILVLRPHQSTPQIAPKSLYQEMSDKS